MRCFKSSSACTLPWSRLKMLARGDTCRALQETSRAQTVLAVQVLLPCCQVTCARTQLHTDVWDLHVLSTADIVHRDRTATTSRSFIVHLVHQPARWVTVLWALLLCIVDEVGVTCRCSSSTSTTSLREVAAQTAREILQGRHWLYYCQAEVHCIARSMWCALH
jgi:hypothetical protein